VNEIAGYSVPFTLGLSYNWTVTNGTIVGPSNFHNIQAQWAAAGTDTVLLVVIECCKLQQ
jgi:hypothetical protein